MAVVQIFKRIKFSYLTLILLFPFNLFSQNQSSFVGINLICKQCQSGNYVITNQTEFKSFLSNISLHTGCIKNDQKIDFNKYVLVGMSTSCGGCQKPDLNIEIITHDEKKEIEVIFHVISYGSCRRAFYQQKWILVSDVPLNYKVNSITCIDYEKIYSNQ